MSLGAQNCPVSRGGPQGVQAPHLFHLTTAAGPLSRISGPGLSSLQLFLTAAEDHTFRRLGWLVGSPLLSGPATAPATRADCRNSPRRVQPGCPSQILHNGGGSPAPDLRHGAGSRTHEGLLCCPQVRSSASRPRSLRARPAPFDVAPALAHCRRPLRDHPGHRSPGPLVAPLRLTHSLPSADTDCLGGSVSQITGPAAGHSSRPPCFNLHSGPGPGLPCVCGPVSSPFSRIGGFSGELRLP
ncbi:hypothetical protein NDU88_000965 [Pleurodeles waltl]|uniref:Uncharacterized protein n=1 Tax=Pleurodeles waltl TaxID=8319 RepID=A0AAV7UUP3_PLEWA|nr:hypothetical protein NDU88_000965 [Pleurodeles waltl]